MTETEILHYLGTDRSQCSTFELFYHTSDSYI